MNLQSKQDIKPNQNGRKIRLQASYKEFSIKKRFDILSGEIKTKKIVVCYWQVSGYAQNTK